MKKWILQSDRDIWQNKDKIVTREQFENYRGKYIYPSDKLLDAIYLLVLLISSPKYTVEL